MILVAFFFYHLLLDPNQQLTQASKELRKYSVTSSQGADSNHPIDNLAVTRDSDNTTFECTAMRMDIQIYEMERGVYLVDFKCDGYETPEGRMLEEKDVTSPFPFLDLAAKLIMQLADAD